MTEREYIAGVASATNLILNLVIRALHNHRIMNKDDLRNTLLEVIGDKMKEDRRRSDVIQFQNLADLLGKAKVDPPWRPVVIQGGKTDPDE